MKKVRTSKAQKETQHALPTHQKDPDTAVFGAFKDHTLEHLLATGLFTNRRKETDLLEVLEQIQNGGEEQEIYQKPQIEPASATETIPGYRTTCRKRPRLITRTVIKIQHYMKWPKLLTKACAATIHTTYCAHRHRPLSPARTANAHRLPNPAAISTPLMRRQPPSTHTS